MAERSGLSPSTIGRIWKAFELKPRRATRGTVLDPVEAIHPAAGTG